MIQIPRYLEVYIATLNSELDRFWSRFNVYASIQALAVVALMLAFDKVQIHPHTARAANMVLFLWSITGALIIWRSVEIHQRLVMAIVTAETSLPDDVRLFREALQSTNPAQLFILRACFSFSLVCSVFWGGMIFLGPYD
ncbi:MAG: hypothetical protein LJE69_11070 [Thiohalocapsa sp.]|jgi:hypothetical protein|uniref:hypothetical protein n=1 Tax=Thiohalocapsa sp. TaxID=2497641 RepID=UPI0025D392C4|nr:hypothetical protein [Thiohalocapsa sp.]MCG6941775.1 hypothetical protein [Thiohalocapsa sp.]